MDEMPEVKRELGEAVLRVALAEALVRFDNRLVAAYALGSLAHGGFSAHVSDVDFAVVLADPLRDEDAAMIAQLGAAVEASGLPLADRLSIFWGSRETLAGNARGGRQQPQGGRFPPLDCLDLKQNGRLLAGEDVRDGVAIPSTQDMVLATTRMSLNGMAKPEVIAQLCEPRALVASGVRPFTKRVLFPVRFVYTARTGRVGTNHDAVRYFAQHIPGPASTLGQKAFALRNHPYNENNSREVAEVSDIARAGLLPLYRLYVEDYIPRLEGYGEAELANAMRAWRERLN